MTVQANREVITPMKPIMGTTTTGVRDFTRMNLPEFYGSKFDDDPQEFIIDIYKIMKIMKVSPVEKVELAAYQLKVVAQVWFNQWKKERDHEDSPDVVANMLNVFHLYVYALLDLDSTLSFVTPYVTMRFVVCPAILLEPFSVSTPVSDATVAKQVCRNCPVSVSHRVTHVDLVELDMLDSILFFG
ncbi:hypothetical protein MTR67_043275 [Solanum verrucosum]|uniref:Gag-pol polyprotein n=1 Tax=Solanum verrucosum TaxID=315347 RepID=A0AAF0UPZ5_SOLVR|nr:hypothetical protein MTR67_043275 [Solanum verrucosum]